MSSLEKQVFDKLCYQNTPKPIGQRKKSGDIRIFKQVKCLWNQLLSMKSHKKTKATADTSPAY